MYIDKPHKSYQQCVSKCLGSPLWLFVKGIQQWPMDSSQNPLTHNVFPCRIFMFPWLYCYLHERHHGNHLRLNYIFISFTSAYLMPFVLSHNLHFNKGGIDTLWYYILGNQLIRLTHRQNITTLKYIVLENASWRLYYIYLGGFIQILTRFRTTHIIPKQKAEAELSCHRMLFTIDVEDTYMFRVPLYHLTDTPILTIRSHTMISAL